MSDANSVYVRELKSCLVKALAQDRDESFDQLVPKLVILFTFATQAPAAQHDGHGNRCSVSGRSRNALASVSKSAQIRETSLLEIPVSAPRALTRSSTVRVEVTCTFWQGRTLCLLPWATRSRPVPLSWSWKA
jgi:hypothetical protein